MKQAWLIFIKWMYECVRPVGTRVYQSRNKVGSTGAMINTQAAGAEILDDSPEKKVSHVAGCELLIWWGTVSC